MRLSLLAAVYKFLIVLHGSLQSLCKLSGDMHKTTMVVALFDIHTWRLQLCGERRQRSSCVHDAVRDGCESGRPLQQPHHTKRSLPTTSKAQSACRNPSSWLALSEHSHGMPGIFKD